MANQDFAGTETVTVGAVARRVDDPLPDRRLYQLAQHDQQPRCPVWPAPTAKQHSDSTRYLWGT